MTRQAVKEAVPTGKVLAAAAHGGDTKHLEGLVGLHRTRSRACARDWRERFSGGLPEAFLRCETCGTVRS